HVPAEHAARVARRRRAPAREALADRRVVHQDVEATLLDVEGDRVALLDRGDRAADGRLGRDVAGHQAARGAAEAAVGQERDLLAQAFTHERRGDAQHLAHARAAARALVADDDRAAARIAEVDRGEPTPRLQIGPHWRAAAYAVEVVDGERHVDLARQRE